MPAPKIFILDDSEQVLELAGHVLMRGGYEVGVAKTVAEMVSRIEGFSPDLLLLDVMMPEMFGYDLVEYVRHGLKLEIPVVLFSSVDERELAGFVLRYGATGYIAKQDIFETLPDAVRGFLPVGVVAP
jgi:CheY-like chemotaxis protein